MKLIKSGLLFVLFLILLSNFVYGSTSINLNLTTTKLGPEVPFDGYLKLNFTDYQALESKISFFVGSSIKDILLKNIINLSNMNFNKLKYAKDSYSNSTSSEDSSIIIGFPFRNGYNNSIGVDLRSANPNIPLSSSDVDVKSVSFDISTVGGSPNDVSISINKKRVYRFRGQPIGWENLDRFYLGDFSPDGEQDIKGGDLFCQSINIDDSGEYIFNVSAKRVVGVPNEVNLNVTMAGSEPLSSYPDCGNSETPCCTITGIGNNDGIFGCTISKSIPEKRPEYVCIYATNPDQKEFFSIRTESTSPVSGYVNGNMNFFNFYIFGSYRKYNTNLLGKAHVTLSADDFNNYILGETGCASNCLLIPLNVTIADGGPASLSFNNFSLRYNAAGISLNKVKFRKISFIPESISYDGIMNVDLNLLEGITTPGVLGKSKIYAKFNGFESNKIDFDIVPAPSAFIRYSTASPGINEAVNFDASGSVAENGKNITSYVWLFGDNTTATGVSVSHIYTNADNYTVLLKVLDSEGVYGVDRVIISVQGVSSADIMQLINDGLKSINSFQATFDTSAPQVKDTAKLIGLDKKLSNLQSNLSGINSSYNELLKVNVSDTQRTASIINFLQQVKDIKNQVPNKINVDTASFSAKISGINQIYSCCEFTTDLQKTKLINAQKNININSEVRTVYISYYDGTSENFMIVKKDIGGSGLKIYEFVPFGVSITPEDVIVGNSLTSPTPNVYSFPFINQLVYRIDDIDLGKALQTRTAVLPTNLEEVVVSEDGKLIPEASFCGNRICEGDENEQSCPGDCKEKSSLPLIILGIIIIIIMGIVYFGFYFKGGLFRKKTTVANAKRLFKSDRDYSSVKDFIEKSFKEGLDEAKIKTALKSKGWSDIQITSVSNEVKSLKKPQTTIKH